jgi:TolB-like protein
MQAMPDLCSPDNCSVSEAEVRSQLDRILGSTWFCTADLLAAFLRFIVEEHLAGQSGRLKERTVAIKVFQRERDFDPRIDTVVRTAACRLRRALTCYYDNEGASDLIRIVVLKGGYRPTIVRSPRQSSPMGPLRSTVPAPSSNGRPISHGGTPVIAVLPLNTLGDNDFDHFLADSVAHKLTIELGKLPLFSVIDFTVSRAAAANGLDPLRVAAKLRADYLLTGSVCSRGAEVRVLSQLSDGRSGVQLWARCIDEPIQSEHTSFGLIDRIVAEIIGAVGDVYGVISELLGHDLSSKGGLQCLPLEAILQHFQFQLRFLPQSCSNVIARVQGAVESSPQLAWGWSALAHLHLESFACLVEVGDALEQANTFIHRAFALAPDDPYVHWVQGLYYMVRGMPDEMMVSLDRTVQRCHYSPFLLGAAGSLLATTGEHKRGLELLDHATQLNRRQPGWFLWGRFLSQYRAGEYREAVTTAEHFSLPDVHWDYLFRSAALAQVGRTEDARLELGRARELLPAVHEAPDKVLQRLLIDRELRDHLLQGVGKPLGQSRRSLKRAPLDSYAASPSAGVAVRRGTRPGTQAKRRAAGRDRG